MIAAGNDRKIRDVRQSMAFGDKTVDPLGDTKENLNYK
jgi:hypothetical protein